MDPNATLQWINDELETMPRDLDRLLELAAALHQWLNRGGHEPNWSEYPRASGAYDFLMHGVRLFGWDSINWPS